MCRELKLNKAITGCEVVILNIANCRISNCATGEQLKSLINKGVLPAKELHIVTAQCDIALCCRHKAVFRQMWQIGYQHVIARRYRNAVATKLCDFKAECVCKQLNKVIKFGFIFDVLNRHILRLLASAFWRA